MKKRKYKLVELRWFDAVSDPSWLTEDKFPEPSLIITTGYLVKVTDWYVVTAGTLSFDGEIPEYGEVLTVPRGMVISMKELGITKRA